MIPGTWTSAFNYSGHNGEWVDNPYIGHRFVTYLNCVAAASRAAHGPGKVIVIAHSMGGLVTRWAAANGAADSIAEVITLGTPNEGASLAGTGDAIRQLFCDTQSMLNGTPVTGSFCTEFTALAGMADYSSQIASLPELPDNTPLHAIAGAQTIKDILGGAWIQRNGTDDLLVPVDSALHQPPDTSQFTTKTIACTTIFPDLLGSCWHGALLNNSAAQADVAAVVRAYVKAHYGPPAPAQGQQPLAGHPPGPDGLSPVNTIYNFYDALNAHDYPAAQKIGLDILGGTDNASWVHNQVLQGKASAYVKADRDLGGGAVQVSVTVTWKDGTVRHYDGTYTVSETSWTITSANPFSSTSASAPASSPAQHLGGESYWLANGGQWVVHDMAIQVIRGDSGLTGTETWNAGPCDPNDPSAGHCWGSAQLAFTLRGDGSLVGTYTTGAMYTANGAPYEGYSQPDAYAPQPGQAITLKPVAPMRAEAVLSSGSTNLCQAGLPDASRYCGA
jgi:pimeloyl-ACP methyl ester carboxylesterase